jgi:hypothetical protein
VNTFRNVDERTTRPNSTIESAELVIGKRNDGVEVLFEEVGIHLKRHIGRKENDALLFDLLKACCDRRLRSY